MPEQIEIVTLTKNRDCKGSVRFEAPKTQGKPPVITDAYLMRACAWVNDAQEVEITVRKVR